VVPEGDQAWIDRGLAPSATIGECAEVRRVQNGSNLILQRS
jgi:hypothetical protein